MYEKREFFRIKNVGQIRAKYAGYSLEVVDVSSSGIRLFKNIPLPESGVLELVINYVSLNMTYEFLREDEQGVILVFKDPDEMHGLFLILKKLKDEGSACSE